MQNRDLTIVEIEAGTLTPARAAQVDAIFFEASGRTFAPGPERAAFRERWLGRFLQGGTDIVLLAIDGGETVAGYLVGALDDPSQQSRFADISYFARDFRDLCRRYPAHLHINLAPGFRNQGVGVQLIENFAARASAAGAPGMHVVTGKQARNVSFYTRCGFVPLRETVWNGSDIVFLGRNLIASV
jgi:GNAT superfamily N-acetyltransferase